MRNGCWQRVWKSLPPNALLAINSSIVGNPEIKGSGIAKIFSACRVLLSGSGALSQYRSSQFANDSELVRYRAAHPPHCGPRLESRGCPSPRLFCLPRNPNGGPYSKISPLQPGPPIRASQFPWGRLTTTLSLHLTTTRSKAASRMRQRRSFRKSLFTINFPRKPRRESPCENILLKEVEAIPGVRSCRIAQ